MSIAIEGSILPYKLRFIGTQTPNQAGLCLSGILQLYGPIGKWHEPWE